MTSINSGSKLDTFTKHFRTNPNRYLSIYSKLSNVTSAIVNIDDFKIHENKDGTFDKTKTDLFLHLVDRRDNSILEVSDVLRLIDQNIEKLDGLFKVNCVSNSLF